MPPPSTRVLPLSSALLLPPERVKQSGVAGAEAFAKDSLFCWLRSNEVPDAEDYLRKYFEERVKKAVAYPDTGDVGLLALDGEGEDGRVIGMAMWRAVGVDLGVRERQAKDETASQPSEPEEPQDPTINEARMADFLQAWEAADNLINSALASNEPITIRLDDLKAKGQPEKVPIYPHIQLTLMGVTPEFQGKGVGSMMLNWGVMQSEHHKVPVVLGASDDGRHLYLKRGFEELGLRLIYVSEEDEKTYGRINDDLLVRWPPGVSRKG